MNSGTVAILGSALAFVIIFILGKRYGKSEATEQHLENLTQAAQDAADAKSAASAEVAQAKQEVAQAKSEASKQRVELKVNGVRADFMQKVAANIIDMLSREESTDEVMQELHTDMETAKRYNNIDQALEIARKQAARAVKLGMTAASEDEE